MLYFSILLIKIAINPNKMSSAGSISAMATSLKNNKLKVRDNKWGHLEFVKGVPIGKPLKFKNKLNEQELQELRTKLKRIKRKNTIITISIFSSIFIILFGFTLKYFW